MDLDGIYHWPDIIERTARALDDNAGAVFRERLPVLDALIRDAIRNSELEAWSARGRLPLYFRDDPALPHDLNPTSDLRRNHFLRLGDVIALTIEAFHAGDADEEWLEAVSAIVHAMHAVSQEARNFADETEEGGLLARFNEDRVPWPGQSRPKAPPRLPPPPGPAPRPPAGPG